MHHCDLAGAVLVRVGIRLWGFAVGGPASVAYADLAADGFLAKFFFQLLDLAQAFGNKELTFF